VVYVSTGIFDREAANSDPSLGTPGGVGVIKSIDGGQTWTPVNRGLDNLYVGTLFMHPRDPDILIHWSNRCGRCVRQRSRRPTAGAVRRPQGARSPTRRPDAAPQLSGAPREQAPRSSSCALVGGFRPGAFASPAGPSGWSSCSRRCWPPRPAPGRGRPRVPPPAYGVAAACKAGPPHQGAWP